MTTLRLGDQEFACRDKVPVVRLMRFVKSFTSVSESMTIDQLSEMIDQFTEFANLLVQPEQRERFDAWLDEADMADLEQLVGQMGEVVQALAGRPKDGTAPAASSSSSISTKRSSRVVSFSQGTVREVPLSEVLPAASGTVPTTGAWQTFVSEAG
ncbi:hypothetical protein GCM10009765_71900 [Fodinicola feengrottensis]|uniref:Uncharacterized protein n=1 Tax=Fodinicola feengrottensis TaxID=435914 RepID=A0ABN2IV40_9ACTN